MSKIKIKDESGDRKYFTQIPNMIVNHSTAYEQSLYLIMKRIAGENGSCYASLNFLSKKMGVHKTTVSKTITKLLKRKWIQESEPKKVKGGQVRQFIIIDLWRINIENYESGADMTTNNVSGSKMTTLDKLSGAVVDESGAIIDESGAKSDTKNIYEEEREEEIVSIATPSVAGKEINEIINYFKPINPSYEKFFKIKTQREALERLLKKIGKEKLINVINFLKVSNNEKYAPTITTPLQLEDKFANLVAFAKKEKSKEINIIKI